MGPGCDPAPPPQCAEEAALRLRDVCPRTASPGRGSAPPWSWVRFLVRPGPARVGGGGQPLPLSWGCDRPPPAGDMKWGSPSNDHAQPAHTRCAPERSKLTCVRAHTHTHRLTAATGVSRQAEARPRDGAGVRGQGRAETPTRPTWWQVPDARRRVPLTRRPWTACGARKWAVVAWAGGTGGLRGCPPEGTKTVSH